MVIRRARLGALIYCAAPACTNYLSKLTLLERFLSGIYTISPMPRIPPCFVPISTPIVCWFLWVSLGANGTMR